MRAVPHLDTGVLCVNVPSLAATHATQGVVTSCAVLEERVGRLPREPQSCRLHVPMFYSPHLFFELTRGPQICSALHHMHVSFALHHLQDVLCFTYQKRRIYMEKREEGREGGMGKREGGREGKEGGGGGRERGRERGGEGPFCNLVFLNHPGKLGFLASNAPVLCIEAELHVLARGSTALLSRPLSLRSGLRVRLRAL